MKREVKKSWNSLKEGAGEPLGKAWEGRRTSGYVERREGGCKRAGWCACVEIGRVEGANRGARERDARRSRGATCGCLCRGTLGGVQSVRQTSGTECCHGAMLFWSDLDNPDSLGATVDRYDPDGSSMDRITNNVLNFGKMRISFKGGKVRDLRLCGSGLWSKPDAGGFSENGSHGHKRPSSIRTKHGGNLASDPRGNSVDSI